MLAVFGKLHIPSRVAVVREGERFTGSHIKFSAFEYNGRITAIQLDDGAIIDELTAFFHNDPGPIVEFEHSAHETKFSVVVDGN